MTRYSPLILMPIALCLATGAVAETVLLVHFADDDLTAVTFRGVDGAVSQSNFASSPTQASALDIQSFFVTTPQDFPPLSARFATLQDKDGNVYRSAYDHEACSTTGCSQIDPGALFDPSSLLLSTSIGHSFSTGSTALSGCSEFDLSGLGFTAADLGSGGDVFAYGGPQVPAIVGQWARDNGPPPFELKLSGIGAVNGDEAGASVAIAGDTVLIGVPKRDSLAKLDAGGAIVFNRFGNGACAQGSLLVDTDPPLVAGDRFGQSVALSGDTAVIGAPFDATPGASGAGEVFVFTRDGDVWTEQQPVEPLDPAGDDNFGTSVAVDGDTALVGSPFDDPGSLTNSGSAYVFTRSAGVWTQQQKLTAGGDVEAFASFGWSVAVSGDTAIIGARFADVDPDGPGGQSFADAGAAYVFTRSGGVWTEQQKLEPGMPKSTGYFGTSVALDGDTAVVGAELENSTASPSGVAYVFTRSGGVWSEQQRLAAGDAASGDLFGVSVALEGNTAVTGASRANVGAVNNAGAAYVFTRSGGVWTELTKLTAGDATANADFGDSVALSGCTVVAGSPGVDSQQGAAYLFDLTAVDDDDGDGICGAVDNCTQIANPAQGDTDADGYGNACDPDLNNDTVVDFGDLPQLQASFFSQVGDPNWNPDADTNGDGVVDFADLPPFQNLFFGPPGPSGLAP